MLILVWQNNLEHRESNPGRQSDSLECYPYTMPDLYYA